MQEINRQNRRRAQFYQDYDTDSSPSDRSVPQLKSRGDTGSVGTRSRKSPVKRTPKNHVSPTMRQLDRAIFLARHRESANSPLDRAIDLLNNDIEAFRSDLDSSPLTSVSLRHYNNRVGKQVNYERWPNPAKNTKPVSPSKSRNKLTLRKANNVSVQRSAAYQTLDDRKLKE